MSSLPMKRSRLVIAMGIVVVLVGGGMLYLVGSTVIGAMFYPSDSREVFVERAREDVGELHAAVTTYRARFGECPVIGQDLVERGLLEAAPRDPWGRNIVFDCGEDHVTVVSPGPDGVLGTDDDVSAR